ncbi:MAG: hypothetical protein EB127_30345, partial [Alphaproteobacteria bacterium]|nr:hypothetical protein [Alphaproteobacteria bacterium]
MDYLPILVGSAGLVEITNLKQAPKDIDFILTKEASRELELEALQYFSYEKVVEYDSKHRAVLPTSDSSRIPIDIEIFDPNDSNCSIALLYEAMKKSGKSRVV